MRQDWIERGKEVLTIEIEGLQSIRERLDQAFAASVELLASCRGRVIITGIGKSGLVGRKIAATMSSTGTPAFFMHPVEGAHGDLGMVRDGDVVIAISYSGKTDELNAILPALRSLGAKLIAITGGMESPLARMADITLDAGIPREACPMNLVPTSSTTATLALGDALAVCLIDRKDFTETDFQRFHPGGSLGQRLALKVSDLMHTRDIPVTAASSTIAEALAILNARGLGAVLLTGEDGRLSGIITDGDVRRMLCQGTLQTDRPARELMTGNPRHAVPDMSAAKLMDIMEEKAITILPVLSADGSIAGIVHLHDILGKGRIRFS